MTVNTASNINIIISCQWYKNFVISWCMLSSAGCLIVYVGVIAPLGFIVQWSWWEDPVLWQCYSSCRVSGYQVDSISHLPAAYWQAACHSPHICSTPCGNTSSLQSHAQFSPSPVQGQWVFGRLHIVEQTPWMRDVAAQCHGGTETHPQIRNSNSSYPSTVDCLMSLMNTTAKHWGSPPDTPN